MSLLKTSDNEFETESSRKIMSYVDDLLTLPAIFWSVYTGLVIYSRQSQPRELGFEQGYGSFSVPELVFIICALRMVLEEILSHIPGISSRGEGVPEELRS